MNLVILLLELICILSVKQSQACLFDHQSQHCRCTKLTVNCTGLELSLEEVLPRLSSHVVSLALGKSWTETPTSVLYPNLIQRFYNLQILDLSRNQITSVEGNTFSNFPFLRQINFSHNRLRLLETNVFVGSLPAIEIIDLSNNHLLLLLDYTFVSVSNLRSLDLRNNHLVYIAKNAFVGLDHLETLQLQRCNLTHFPRSSFIPLTSLLQFTASHFRYLSGMPSLSFKCNKQLGELHLDNMIHLSQFTLSKGAFQSLTNLHTLKMRNCGFTAIPHEALFEINQLISLDFSGNHIKVIRERDFAFLVNLKVLILRDNNVENIPSEAFVFLRSLRKIDLSKNRLKLLKRNAFPSNLNSIQYLEMKANPLVCSCELFWMIEVRKFISPSLECYNSTNKQNYNLSMLLESNFSCNKPLLLEQNKKVLYLSSNQSDQENSCLRLSDLPKFQKWRLPLGFRNIWINHSIYENYMILHFRFIGIKDHYRTGYFCVNISMSNAKYNRKEEIIKSSNTVQLNAANISSLWTPVLLGVFAMLSGFILLTIIFVFVWTCKVRKKNSLLKNQIQFILSDK